MAGSTMLKIISLLIISTSITSSAWAKPGDLKSVQRLYVLSAEQINQGKQVYNSKILSQRAITLISSKKKTSSILPKIPPTLNGVTLYKLTYETTDVQGKPTVASGELMIPASLSDATPFPQLSPSSLVSYQHGTIVKKDQAPSEDKAQGETLIAVFFFASRGYVVAAADYLGLGSSTTAQAYDHSATEATATRDMLRASKLALSHLEYRPDGSKLSVPINEKLFLTGYSQGGHATLALQKLLESDKAAEFKVTASAPMAGAYNLSHTAKDILENPYPFISSLEIAFVIYSMDLTYHLFANLNEAVNEPWASQLPKLFDGTHDLGEVAKAMPEKPQALLKSNFVKGLLSGKRKNSFLRALRANDLYKWKPLSPTLILAGGGDREVPFTINSKLAYDAMISLGGNVVDLIDVGGLDHPAAVFPAFQEAAEWIDTF